MESSLLSGQCEDRDFRSRPLHWALAQSPRSPRAFRRACGGWEVIRRERELRRAVDRKTRPLLTNRSCCQLLPNLQRTHRDKEFLFPCIDLFLLLPAPPHNQDPQLRGSSPLRAKPSCGGHPADLLNYSLPSSQRGSGNTPGLPSRKVSILAPHIPGSNRIP